MPRERAFEPWTGNSCVQYAIKTQSALETIPEIDAWNVIEKLLGPGNIRERMPDISGTSLLMNGLAITLRNRFDKRW